EPVVAAVGVAGCLLLIVFVRYERRSSEPKLPLAVFRSRQSSCANAATLANYLAIGAMFFFLSLQLQDVLGYSALAAGAASSSATLVMLLCTPQAGKLGEKIAARIPMTVGPLVLGVGLVMLAGVEQADAYVPSVLQGGGAWG